MFNRAGPTGDTELDRRASKKTRGIRSWPHGWTLHSLEECPGQHKVLVRRKPRWQSGHVRNIDDCSENGINETFESKETYKPAGIDHNVSAIKQWEASLPGVKLHGFVADLWKHFRQIGIGLNLIVVFWCHNSGSRKFLAFLWQCVHFCNIICSFPCSTIKMIITVWSLITVLHKLGRSSSTYIISLVQSWPLLVATSFRNPAKFTFCVAPRFTSPFYRVKFESFPRETIRAQTDPFVQEIE